MIILIATATWIFLIVLALSLCLSARRGDLMELRIDVGEYAVGRSDPLAIACNCDADEGGQAQPGDPQQAAA
jgi:hypothetical protein